VACVHAQIMNGDTKEVYTCRIGVEMPLETNSGPISTPLAQRISAECANEAAYAVLSTLTKPPPPPMYSLCTAVIDAYALRLNTAIVGSRVKTKCDPRARPVVFGVPAPAPWPVETSMPPSLSAADLAKAVRSYYDSSNDFLFTSEPTPEENRRQALWTQWIENMEPWKAFRAALKSELPNYIIGETYSSADGGPRCIVYPPKDSRTPSSNWLVVGCVSLLAPVYFVYGAECDYVDGSLRNIRYSFEPPPPNMSLPAQVVARTIEASFGFSAVPREIVEMPVPLFAGLLQPPKTTLFHALFTSAPNSIP
jgi:hypothetical protein